MRARAALAVQKGSHHWRDDPPVALRRTGGSRFHIVQTAGGPIGGDDLELDLDVGDGAEVELCSAAATVVQPGTGAEPARWLVRANLGDGARLRLAPQPAVVCERACYETELSANLAAGARAALREEITLGRVGETGGRYRGRLAVTVDGLPLVRHESILDGADADLNGPAGSGGYRAIGTMLIAGDTVSLPDEHAHREAGLLWSVSPLAGPGLLVVVLSASSSAASRTLDDAERRFAG